MRRLARLSLVLAVGALLGMGVRPMPANACTQEPDGRCMAAEAACHPPADGRCLTVAASSLSKLRYACRCQSPRTFGPSASNGSNTCRQRCSGADITCESRARSYSQRNLCTSRAADCNSHCN
jgi:hypothetical protein